MTEINKNSTAAEKRRLGPQDTPFQKKYKSNEPATTGNQINEGPRPDYQSKLYQEDDMGPYRVHIEYVESPATANLEIKSLTVGQLLQTRLKLPGVVDVKKFGRKTVTIYFNDHNQANQLVSSKELQKYNLKAFIPDSYLVVSGISRGVDLVVDLEDLKQELQLNYPVTKVERLTRFDKEAGKRVETTSIKITLRLSKLPDEVFAYKTKLKISPFIGHIKQCEKCLRYGHFADQCKSKNARCKRCGEAEHGAQGCCTVKCLHCKGDHEATYDGCEEKVRQRNIKFLMAKNNMGYFEAVEAYPTYTRNSFDLLERAEEFPQLERKSYARATKLTPRSRVLSSEKPRKIWANKKPTDTQLTAAEQQPDPLNGPSINFINQNKSTEIERTQDEFDKFHQSLICDTQSLSASSSNTQLFKIGTTTQDNTSEQIKNAQSISDSDNDSMSIDNLEMSSY